MIFRSRSRARRGSSVSRDGTRMPWSITRRPRASARPGPGWSNCRATSPWTR
ncbi:Uncharacterised protein [Bordetella pertussis]|nr:Uncharacterised protein [Bordetella pertussis]